MTAIARFESRIKQDGDCWIWTGAISGGGYGTLSVRSRSQLAHRWSYEYHVAPIPEGLEIDHLCGRPRCVNPQHLEPVTHRENVMRSNGIAARNAAKTHCFRGHKFTEENTGIRKTGARRCRACQCLPYRVQRKRVA